MAQRGGSLAPASDNFGFVADTVADKDEFGFVPDAYGFVADASTPTAKPTPTVPYGIAPVGTDIGSFKRPRTTTAHPDVAVGRPGQPLGPPVPPPPKLPRGTEKTIPASAPLQPPPAVSTQHLTPSAMAVDTLDKLVSKLAAIPPAAAKGLIDTITLGADQQGSHPLDTALGVAGGLASIPKDVAVGGYQAAKGLLEFPQALLTEPLRTPEEAQAEYVDRTSAFIPAAAAVGGLPGARGPISALPEAASTAARALVPDAIKDTEFYKNVTTAADRAKIRSATANMTPDFRTSVAETPTSGVFRTPGQLINRALKGQLDDATAEAVAREIHKSGTVTTGTSQQVTDALYNRIGHYTSQVIEPIVKPQRGIEVANAAAEARDARIAAIPKSATAVERQAAIDAANAEYAAKPTWTIGDLEERNSALGQKTNKQYRASDIDLLPMEQQIRVAQDFAESKAVRNLFYKALDSSVGLGGANEVRAANQAIGRIMDGMREVERQAAGSRLEAGTPTIAKVGGVVEKFNPLRQGGPLRRASAIAGNEGPAGFNADVRAAIRRVNESPDAIRTDVLRPRQPVDTTAAVADWSPEEWTAWQNEMTKQHLAKRAGVEGVNFEPPSTRPAPFSEAPQTPQPSSGAIPGIANPEQRPFSSTPIRDNSVRAALGLPAEPLHPRIQAPVTETFGFGGSNPYIPNTHPATAPQPTKPFWSEFRLKQLGEGSRPGEGFVRGPQGTEGPIASQAEATVTPTGNNQAFYDRLSSPEFKREMLGAQKAMTPTEFELYARYKIESLKREFGIVSPTESTRTSPVTGPLITPPPNF